MGWTISHTDGGPAHCPSELINHVRWNAPRLQDVLADLDPDTPLAMSPQDAGHFAKTIRASAHHNQLPARVRDQAHEIARAATRAANAGQTWTWTWH